MSPERPRRGKPDPVRFPFGETFDGNIEDIDLDVPVPGIPNANKPHVRRERREPSDDAPGFESSGTGTPLPKGGDLARRTMELRIEDIEGLREEQEAAPSKPKREFDPFESHGDTPIVLREEDADPTATPRRPTPQGRDLPPVRGARRPEARGQPLGQPSLRGGQQPTLPPGYQARGKPPAGAGQTLPPGYEVRRAGPGGPPPGSKQTLPPGYEVRRTGRPMSGPPPAAPPLAGMDADGTVAPGYEVRRTGPGGLPLGSKQTLPPGYEVRRTGRPMSGPPPAAPPLAGMDADGTVAPGYPTGPAGADATVAPGYPTGPAGADATVAPGYPTGRPGEGTVAPGYLADRTASPNYPAPLAAPRRGTPPGPPAAGPPLAGPPMSAPPSALDDPFASKRGAPPPPGTPPRGFPRPAQPDRDDPFASERPDALTPPRGHPGQRPPARPPGGWESDLEASPLGEEAPELRRGASMGPPKAAIDLFGSSDETPVPALYDSDDPDAEAGDSFDPDRSWGNESNTFAIEDSIDGVMAHRLRGDSQYDSIDSDMGSMDSLGDSLIPDSMDPDDPDGGLIMDSGPDRPAARPLDDSDDSDLTEDLSPGAGFRRSSKKQTAAPAPSKRKKGKKGTPSDSDAEVEPVKAGAIDRMVGLVTSDLLWIILSLGGALLGPLLIYLAWDYYGLAPHLRPGHTWDRLLKSGGGLGLWFGIGGSLLFLLNLTYIARRRFGALKKWISLRLWLNVHFLCGLTGGSLILAHSALKFDNWVARVSAFAILIAIASGLFGRYVLIHMPRRQEGESYDRADLAAALASLRRDLRQALAPYPPLRRVALEALEATELEEAEPKGILFVGQLVLGDFKARRKTRDLEDKLRAELSRLSQDQDLEPLIDETLELVHLSSRLNRRLSQFEAVQDLMETWRAIHMILALIMVVTMLLHVTIVLTYSRISWFG